MLINSSSDDINKRKNVTLYTSSLFPLIDGSAPENAEVSEPIVQRMNAENNNSQSHNSKPIEEHFLKVRFNNFFHKPFAICKF